MATDIDYAWMAAAAYNESRGEEKRVDTANGWKTVDQLEVKDAASGFAAKVYQQIPSQGSSGPGEIVIAFRGTDFEGNPFATQFRKDYFATSFPLMNGRPSDHSVFANAV
jgi:hypothetical protein